MTALAGSQLRGYGVMIAAMLVFALSVTRRSRRPAVQTPAAKRRLDRRTRIAAGLIVLLIPLTFVCYAFGLQRFWLLFLLTEASSLAVFLLLGLGGRYKKAELPEERIFQRTILSNAEDVMDVCRELEAFCEIWGADMKQQMFSTMTVEELGMAILKHGFQGRADGYLQLTAIMDESGVLELHLRDDATTFNPFALDTSRASRDEAFDMDGMGVLVIKKRAKEFFYRRYQGFNTLIIKI